MKLYTNQMKNLSSTLPASKPIELRNGQIFYGKVHSIDPFGNAVVELGNRQIVAKIEARIDVKENYWFIVQHNGGKVLLKLLADRPNEDSLIKYFDLKPTPHLRALLSAFSKWGLTINKEDLTIYKNWLQNSQSQTAALEVIKTIHMNDLPRVNLVFNGLLSQQNNPSITQLLEEFQSFLNREMPHNKPDGTLIIDSLLGQGTKKLDLNNGTSVYRGLIQILHKIGFLNQNNANQAEPSLFDGLLKIIQNEELSANLKQSAQQILNYLAGTKLQMNNEDQWFQWSFAIPLPLADETIDAFIKWRGKKQKGEKEQNFAQIIIDLQMPNLGKTIIFLNIQQNILTINCKSDYEAIEAISKPLITNLQKKLNEMGFVLSSVKFEKITSNKQFNNVKEISSLNKMSKVDITI